MHKYVLGAVLALAAVAAQADVLLIDTLRQDQQSSQSRPQPGTTMSTVEQQFGTPEQRRGAIGEPPIARWEYPGFVVYFEHDRVIHTVVRR